MGESIQATDKRIVGVVLAGGQARRMGNRVKPLLKLRGRPLLAHVIEHAARQTESLVISVNRDRQAYADFGLPLVADADNAPSGPLAGIAAALDWFQARGTGADYLACFPGDVPGFPDTVVQTLLQGLNEYSRDTAGQPVVWCRTGDQPQPLFSLWPFTAAASIHKAVADGTHGPRLFFEHHANHCVNLPPARGLMFFNINTPDDLRRAETLAGQSKTP